MAAATEITLGSGKLYIAKHTEGEEIDLATLCVDANQVGYIQGGATLEYKPTIYTVESDLKEVVRRFITSEEVTLKSGLLTWNLDALDKVIGNKTYTADTTTKKNVMKLGNPGAVEQETFCVAFVHTKSDGTVIRIGIVGTNNDGISMAFASDKETVIDCTFSAVTADVSTGVLCIIEEDESGKKSA